MKLYQEILAEILRSHSLDITLQGEALPLEALVRSSVYRALEEIKAVLEDDSLDDPDCFIKIEKIVQIFESLGSDCGTRHDFG